MKESFLLYKSFYDPIKELSIEDKGHLFDAIFKYQIEGVEPINTSSIYMPFMFFKNQFRLDDIKYQRIVDRNKVNGSKGGRPRNPSEPKKPSGLFGNPKNPNEPKKPDNDNVKDKDKDKEIIYSLYPTKCPIKKNSTGKSRKANLGQIENLLKEHTVEHLKNAIQFYVEDCKKSNTYIKNFKTFLNNIPDIEEKESAKQKTMIQYNLMGQTPKYCNVEEWAQIQKTYTIQIESYKEVLR